MFSRVSSTLSRVSTEFRGGLRDSEGNQFMGGSTLTNEQRTELLDIFNRYIQRVSSGLGGAGSDLMMRSTWFRFLHHCGILGPASDVLQGPKEKSVVKKSVIKDPKEATPRQSFMSTFSLRSNTVGLDDAQIDTAPGTQEEMLDYGRQGGISLTEAAVVFGIYQEVSPSGAPALAFASWVNAVQHILRGPTFYRSHKDVIANLFGVFLKRCQKTIGFLNTMPKRMGSRTSSILDTTSTDGSSVAGKSYRKQSSRLAKQGSRKNSQCSAFSVASSTVSGAGRGQLDLYDVAALMGRNKIDAKDKANVGILGWQADRAEEEMCEPEVILLLHEYEAPLREIFMLYAKSRGEPTMSSCFQTQDEVKYSSNRSVTSSPSLTADCSISRQISGASTDGLSECDSEDDDGVNAKMHPDAFLHFIREFGFFPKVVQHHSVQQHLEISLTRRNAKRLTYGAFIECLLRISFVFLSIYGNSIQQAACAKAKCIWLLTFLRSRCATLSHTQQSGTPMNGDEWLKRAVDIDTLQLRDMVLWPALDAPVKPPVARKKLKADDSERSSFVTGLR